MPNYSHWDLLEEIKLEEAVCLWCEIEPGDSPRARRARHPDSVPVERFLLAAIKKGELPLAGAGLLWGLSMRQKELPDDDGAFVRKADLRKLAEQKGVRPRFLFPEGKATEIASTIPPPTDGKDETPLGRRIKSVLKNAADLRARKQALSLRGIASVLTNGGDCEGFGDSTVRQILSGTYSASKRLGKGGLEAWTFLDIVQKK